MTQTQINCFLTVADQGSFAKAAGILFISIPAVSKNVSKMEEELGFSFFEHHAGRLMLTPGGESLYRFFRQYNNSFEKLLTDIHNSLHISSETVNIGCPDLWNPACFYDDVCSHMKKVFPDIRITVDCYRPAALISALQSGKADIVLNHDFYYSLPQGIIVSHLTETGHGILYYPRYYPEVKTLADLKDADFLIYDPDYKKAILPLLRKVCGMYGFSPRIKSVVSLSAAAFFISSGKGVFFCSEWENLVRCRDYEYLPVNSSTAVNIIYPQESPNASVRAIVKELIWLFSKR